MKKHIFLTLLMLISLVGLSQTPDKYFNQLIDSVGKTYNIRSLGSDETEKYRLNQITPKKVKMNGETVNQFCILIFVKEGDNTKYELKTLSTKEAVYSLDRKKNYIYIVNNKLFYKENE